MRKCWWLVQLWQIRGGQTKYTGHTCNFPRENAKFHAKVSLLPEKCDIIIMGHTGVKPGGDDAKVAQKIAPMFACYGKTHALLNDHIR